MKNVLIFLLILLIGSGCASTPKTRGDVEKGVEMGLEATYWATYTAGKALEIPKLATGGPAPSLVFGTGLKAILLPLGLVIKATKGKEKVEVESQD